MSYCTADQLLVQLLHAADHIIALSTEGNITEQGAFRPLKHSQGYVSGLVAESKQPKHEDNMQDVDSVAKQTQIYLKPAASTEQGKSVKRTRRTGDFSIYNYYAKHAGVAYLAMFFCLQFATITLYKAPRTFILFSRLFVPSLTNN